MKGPVACTLILAAATAQGPAAADAIPPPELCPPGQVSVTGHGGPRCEDPKTTDCQPGWKGAGGRCVLAVCETDAHCGPDLACREQPVCFEQHDEHEWIPVNVCGPDAEPCSTPAECRPGKLCLPRTGAVARPMPRDADGTLKARPGCGCGSTSPPAGVAGLLLALGTALLLWRRQAP